MRKVLLLALLTLCLNIESAGVDRTKDAVYLALRDSVHHSFNDGDCDRFFHAVSKLEDYLLSQNDLHEYYTQRCNEIVFLMNQQKIYEAYRKARQLSKELRERKLDKEMYMAVNMMGHINRYCGNNEAAKQCFYQVIDMMEKEGYQASIPPIYMNIVNVEIGDDPEEAQLLMDKAKKIAEEYAPERVFDIETRKSVSYFNNGDIKTFLKGYQAYREGVAKGLSSVHGRLMEVYYLAAQGRTDEAVKMAKEELSDDGYDVITMIYEKAGRWKDAYQTLRKGNVVNDSIVNVVLINSMQGIEDEMELYEAKRQTDRNRFIGLSLIILLLLLLSAALTYIVLARRRHMSQLKSAYNHALESDKMKTAFIQNVSHEVRTPLNIISGFAQVIADPELAPSTKDRQEIAKMMRKNTKLITSLVDEMLMLSLNEAEGSARKDDKVEVNDLLRYLLQENQSIVQYGVALHFETQVDDDFAFMTNENMLKNIVNALIDNAAKNTEKGSITLKADANEEVFTLTVEDTGCGIPPNEAERVFERFVKLNTFKEGIGLGLSLCRTLAERLSGSIRLDTTYTQGARFVVTIPIPVVQD